MAYPVPPPTAAPARNGTRLLVVIAAIVVLGLITALGVVAWML